MTETESELLFQSFCNLNGLPWLRVEAGGAPTPDYLVTVPTGGQIYFEVKQIDEDANVGQRNGVSSRTVGDHVRAKVNEARGQMKFGAALGLPSVLLVHNNLDPLQLFGTERHDFLAAMYGEMTVLLQGGRISDSFHGRNSTLREGHNSSFSAVGHLRRSTSGPVVEMYENVFARVPLNPSLLPQCFGFLRIEVTESAA